MTEYRVFMITTYPEKYLVVLDNVDFLAGGQRHQEFEFWCKIYDCSIYENRLIIPRKYVLECFEEKWGE